MTLNRNNAVKKVSWLALAAVLACGGGLLLLRNHAVLISLGGDVRNDHGFQILNPLRNRRTEQPAGIFLDRLKAGQCAALLGRMDPDHARVTSICGSEREYPITHWTLAAVGVDRGRTLLRYRVVRIARGKRVDDPFWIWVGQGSNGSWEVTGYEPWY